MGIEENKEIVRRFFEGVNRHEPETLTEFCTSDYVGHYTDHDSSAERTKEILIMFLSAFPDFNASLDDLVAEGNKVAFRVIYRGTHTGDFRGNPPSGNKFEMVNSGIFRITNGKLAELWFTMDELHMMRDLGIIPTN